MLAKRPLFLFCYLVKSSCSKSSAHSWQSIVSLTTPHTLHTLGIFLDTYVSYLLNLVISWLLQLPVNSSQLSLIPFSANKFCVCLLILHPLCERGFLLPEIILYIFTALSIFTRLPNLLCNLFLFLYILLCFCRHIYFNYLIIFLASIALR